MAVTLGGGAAGIRWVREAGEAAKLSAMHRTAPAIHSELSSPGVSSAKAEERCYIHRDVSIASLSLHGAGGMSSCKTTCIAHDQVLPISQEGPHLIFNRTP